MIDETVDITIIGAGVIGLAVAKEISPRYKNIVVLEKNDSYGQETSSRTGEVIHSGMYFPPRFFKGDFCRPGNIALFELCAKHNIPHKRVGKLIVANGTEEVDRLERIRIGADINGVNDLFYLSQRQIHSFEPDIRAEAALFSPSTGIIDSHRLMYYFLKTTQFNGADVVFRSKVTGILHTGHGYLVEVNCGEYIFRTKILINCAGLYSDCVAGLVGINTDRQAYRIHYSKGTFFSAVPSPKLNHLVWPVNVRNKNKKKRRAIHADLDMGGSVKFGPYWENVDKLDYEVDESQKEFFHKSISTYLPQVALESLKPTMSGIRPQLHGPQDSYRDFVIRDEASLGYPGLINLVGIECPGLTACIPIARYVKTLLSPYFE